MRNKAALYGAAIALVLVASTLALPASRTASAGGADAAQVEATPQTQGSITVHQLLRSRLDWSLRLTRALRLIDQPPAPPSSYGTLTIIDEPDPAGREDDGEDPPSGDRPTPVDRDSNHFRDWADGIVEPGAS
jgi:hypothetical protein